MYRLILCLVQGQERSTRWGVQIGFFFCAVLYIICIYCFVSILLLYNLWHLVNLYVLKVRISCLSLFWTLTSVLHVLRSSLVNVGHHLEVGRVSRATWPVAASSWSTWWPIWRPGYWLKQLANSDAIRRHVTGRNCRRGQSSWSVGQ